MGIFGEMGDEAMNNYASSYKERLFLVKIIFVTGLGGRRRGMKHRFSCHSSETVPPFDALWNSLSSKHDDASSRCRMIAERKKWPQRVSGMLTMPQSVAQQLSLFTLGFEELQGGLIVWHSILIGFSNIRTIYVGHLQ